ncbi:MAG TPA: flagellar hook-basal body protein [Gaiellaceae bacterium]|nr:flagellar hook-basal body protein [Gaiellaceae bacterium]
MDRGLYIAASGMVAELTRQDQVANDLANASTPGYKPDRSAQQSFGELLLQNTADGAAVGTLGLGARISRTVTDLSPRALEQTGEPLDVALDGDGFLAVETPAGRRYTRDGQLTLDAEGRLRTATGYLVLGDDGRPIRAGSASGLEIAADGTVRSGGRAVGRLGVVSLREPVKQGDTLFAGLPGPRPAATAVRQGYLEGSGVDATTALVGMLQSLRAYQSDQQAIQAIDETLEKGIAAGGI